MSYLLSNPPKNQNARDLWLQDAAGFIIFEAMKKYALDRSVKNTNKVPDEQLHQIINDGIYGLMMLMDGIGDTLSNQNYTVRLQTKILLEKDDQLLEELDTLDGDGMCMGFHEWKTGNFGDSLIVKEE